MSDKKFTFEFSAVHKSKGHDYVHFDIIKRDQFGRGSSVLDGLPTDPRVSGFVDESINKNLKVQRSEISNPTNNGPVFLRPVDKKTAW